MEGDPRGKQVQSEGLCGQVLCIAAGMLKAHLAAVAEYILGYDPTAQQPIVGSRPDGPDDPYPLVPGDRGIACPVPTIDHLEIDGADTAGRHPHEDLFRSGAWGGPFLYL